MMTALRADHRILSLVFGSLLLRNLLRYPASLAAFQSVLTFARFGVRGPGADPDADRSTYMRFRQATGFKKYCRVITTLLLSVTDGSLFRRSLAALPTLRDHLCGSPQRSIALQSSSTRRFDCFIYGGELDAVAQAAHEAGRPRHPEAASRFACDRLGTSSRNSATRPAKREPHAMFPGLLLRFPHLHVRLGYLFPARPGSCSRSVDPARKTFDRTHLLQVSRNATSIRFWHIQT